MADENIIISCPGCGTRNRVPVDLMNKGPRCGRCKTPLSGKPLTLTDSNIDGIVSSSMPVVVDCWAPWCGPCRMIAPVMEGLAGEYTGRVLIGKLNVDENPLTSQKYQIRSIPTLLFFKSGRLVDSIVGAVPEQQIRQRLSALL